ncbi:DoxX family protein [Solihabitans fulvus]|uniref:DoxX family protein n=1 Tax=Solihabitans fulvus TaxID=1892852 RepID=A0A5B2XIU5_9PSEU|nr:DoxX family protein [Solihabitans fulvus]KAA2263747.1 DoxX family protein [Solihabitans fulvus]
MQLLDRGKDHIVALFRIVVGVLFTCHGAAGVFGVLGGHSVKGGTIPVGQWPSWWAALIQLVGGALVALGLGTRYAALICSGSMAYAYFTVHQPKALLPIQNSGEAAAMFCWAFLLIAFVGPGPWALDQLRALRAKKEQQPAQAH